MEELEEIKKKLEQSAHKVKEVNFLFLDVSSSCTGYAVVSLDFERKKAKFLTTGGIWLPDTEQEHKCAYVYNAVANYFNIVEHIDYVVLEQYMINPKKISGCMVTPELHGAIKAALSEVGTKYSYIPVQTWRAQLGIKKNSSGDFKQPTKEKVLESVAVPEKVTSNITGSERNTPSDVYDALAIAMGWLKKMGFTSLDFKDLKFQTHVGVIGEN